MNSNLNTSHIKLQPGQVVNFLEGFEFKYISY